MVVYYEVLAKLFKIFEKTETKTDVSKIHKWLFSYLKDLDTFVENFNLSDLENDEKYRELDAHFKTFTFFLVKYYRILALDESYSSTGSSLNKTTYSECQDQMSQPFQSKILDSDYKPTYYVYFIKELYTQSMGLFIWIFMAFFFVIRYKKKKLKVTLEPTLSQKPYNSLSTMIEYTLNNFHCFSKTTSCPAKHELDFKEDEFLDFYSIYIYKLGILKESSIGQTSSGNQSNRSESSLMLPLVVENDILLEIPQSINNNTNTRRPQNVRNQIGLAPLDLTGIYNLDVFVRKTEREPFEKEMPNYSEVHGSLEFFVNYLAVNRMNYFRRCTLENRGISPQDVYKSVHLIKDNWSEQQEWSNYTNGKCVKLMLDSWLVANTKKMNYEEKATIERYIINISLFPGLPIIYLLDKLFGGKEDQQKEMQFKCLAYLPRLQKSAIVSYQHKISKFLDLYNPYIHDLDYFSIPKPLPSTGAKRGRDDAPTENKTKEDIVLDTHLSSDIFALILFDKLIANEMFYLCFFYRFVILQKSFYKHQTAIERYSHTSPLFVQCAKNKFYMIHKEEFYYSNIYALIEFWIRQHHKYGIPPLLEMKDCPWIPDWLEELPKSYKEVDLFHGLYIKKNYVKPDKIYEEDKSEDVHGEDNSAKKKKQLSTEDFVDITSYLKF